MCKYLCDICEVKECYITGEACIYPEAVKQQDEEYKINSENYFSYDSWQARYEADPITDEREAVEYDPTPF